MHAHTHTHTHTHTHEYTNPKSYWGDRYYNSIIFPIIMQSLIKGKPAVERQPNS